MAAYRANAAAYERDNGDAMADEVGRMVDLLRPGGRVIDAGCGPGRDVARFRQAGLHVAGIDLSEALCVLAAESGGVVLGDLRVLPFRDGAFDGIWACASLVHLDAAGTGTALGELARVARDGAPAFVSVKSTAGGDSGWAETRYGRRWFSRWQPEEIVEVLEAAGFCVDSVGESGEFVDVWCRRCV